MSCAPDKSRASRTQLDEVVRRYYAPLLSFFRKRTSNSPDVQDLVQQVFLRLAQHPQLHSVENPDAYIFQTASNALKDHYRRVSIRDRHAVRRGEPDAAEDADSLLSPERVIQGQEAMAHLVDALRELPERTRDVFMLRCLEGLKHAEVAQLLGMSIRSVQKHMVKALTHVSRAVEHGSTPP